jgi:hypothetical protein
MSRSSARRGQTELSALVAVFAVCVALALYAGVVGDALPVPERSRSAEQAADRAADLASVDGSVRPDRLPRSNDAAPAGGHANVTLAAAGRRWQVGPPAPGNATSATRRVSVRLGPGRIRSGQLRARVWR